MLSCRYVPPFFCRYVPPFFLQVWSPFLLCSNFGQIPPVPLSKSCRPGSTDNIYQSFHKASLFSSSETRKFSFLHMKISGAPLIIVNLNDQITGGGNLSKNAKERVRECSDAAPPPYQPPSSTYSKSPPSPSLADWPAMSFVLVC